MCICRNKAYRLLRYVIGIMYNKSNKYSVCAPWSMIFEIALVFDVL